MIYESIELFAERSTTRLLAIGKRANVLVECPLRRHLVARTSTRRACILSSLSSRRYSRVMQRNDRFVHGPTLQLSRPGYLYSNNPRPLFLSNLISLLTIRGDATIRGGRHSAAIFAIRRRSTFLWNKSMPEPKGSSLTSH